MTTSTSFSTFLNNIKVDKSNNINSRYKEITKKLNRTFRDTDSETANSLQVGSYGRYTGIKGISDLDMLYIMPKCKWNDYKNKPSTLLADVRDAIQERYPTTSVCYDRLVIDVKFSDFIFEIQPVFEENHEDGNIRYKYPDTKYGCYKITKPKHEQQAMADFKREHGEHHRYLCKMVRAWKNHVGVGMGGLLIDTLTYNFLSNRSDLDFSTYSDFNTMSRDFFEYLKNQPKQEHYQALGSHQDVKVKHPFRTKAMETYEICKKAIDENDETKKNDYWREVFGHEFPKHTEGNKTQCFSTTCVDNEQFIEDYYPVDILEEVTLECTIEREGFRTKLLSEVLQRHEFIPKNYKLFFKIKSTTVTGSYNVKWKVRNVGEEAIRRNCLRGQIEDSNKGSHQRKEESNFYGPHFVECYIIKNGIVIARAKINVPIEH